MGRRSDHTREELRELALAAARKMANEKGWRAITARGVAREIGYTVGTIYILFENLNDLVLQMNGRTMDELYGFVTKDPIPDESVEALRELGRRYLAYIEKHPYLWAAVFEAATAHPSDLPSWYLIKAQRLVGLGEAALKPFFGSKYVRRRRRHAYVLWSGLYGITSLALGQKLPRQEDPTALLDSLIETYIAGLVEEVKTLR